MERDGKKWDRHGTDMTRIEPDLGRDKTNMK